MTSTPVRAQTPLRQLDKFLTPPVHTLPPDATLADLARRFQLDARSRTAYLVTPGGGLVGVVPFRALRRHVHPRVGARFPGLVGLLQRLGAAPVRRAADLAVSAAPARPDTRLRDALFQMDLRRLTDLPVVDARGRLVRELTHEAHARLLAELLASTSGAQPGPTRQRLARPATPHAQGSDA